MEEAAATITKAVAEMEAAAAIAVDEAAAGKLSASSIRGGSSSAISYAPVDEACQSSRWQQWRRKQQQSQ